MFIPVNTGKIQFLSRFTQGRIERAKKITPAKTLTDTWTVENNLMYFNQIITFRDSFRWK